MAWINKPEKKKRNSFERTETDMRQLRKKGYNNTQWKKLRETYLKNNPLCADCLAKGKITPATSVHHIKSPFKNGEINYGLLLDYDNLMSLCHECHGERHAEEQGHKSPEKIIEELDSLFENHKDL